MLSETAWKKSGEVRARAAKTARISGSCISEGRERLFTARRRHLDSVAVPGSVFPAALPGGVIQ
jgi:hypothetical protein